MDCDIVIWMSPAARHRYLQQKAALEKAKKKETDAKTESQKGETELKPDDKWEAFKIGP